MAKTQIADNGAVSLSVNTTPIEKAVDVVEEVASKVANTVEHGASVVAHTSAADVASSTMDVLSEAMDLTEQALDHIETAGSRVATVTRNNPYILAGVAVAAAGLGAFVAYKVVSKQLVAKYETEIEVQVEAARDASKRIHKEEEFATPESAVEALIGTVSDEEVDQVRRDRAAGERTEPYRGTKVAYDKVKPAEGRQPPAANPVASNIFQERDNTAEDIPWNYDEELAHRAAEPDKPFVVSYDEWYANETEAEQASLTYYLVDDMLVDDTERPLSDTDSLVGDDNLQRFGAGSKDPLVVYIQNNELDTIFEITKVNGAYHELILGGPRENVLMHSEPMRRRTPRRSERD